MYIFSNECQDKSDKYNNMCLTRNAVRILLGLVGVAAAQSICSYILCLFRHKQKYAAQQSFSMLQFFNFETSQLLER